MTKWDTHGARKASLQFHLFIPFVYPQCPNFENVFFLVCLSSWISKRRVLEKERTDQKGEGKKRRRKEKKGGNETAKGFSFGTR